MKHNQRILSHRTIGVTSYYGDEQVLAAVHRFYRDPKMGIVAKQITEGLRLDPEYGERFGIGIDLWIDRLDFDGAFLGHPDRTVAFALQTMLLKKEREVLELRSKLNACLIEQELNPHR